MANALPPRQRTDAEHWRWFRRLMVWVLAISQVVVAVAVTWLLAGGAPPELHLLIALWLGITLSVMLGAGLMGLVFVSSRTGIDDGVAELPPNDTGEAR